jgi:hypothetical protein
MKEKKGKKSLRDVENLVVKRSTRLKQLSKTVSNSLGTSTVSISTTSSSDLPPSLYIVNDSIKICTIVGIYINRRKPFNTPYKIYDASNLIYIGGGNNVVGGWFYYKNPNGGYTNFSNTIFGNVNGYLFLFFGKTNIMINNRGGVCTQCFKKTDPDVYDECEVFDTNQGPIFAVVISSIAQINALNLTYAYQSDKKFLSAAIKSAIDGNSSLKNVITQIKESTGETTPILTYNPVHPLLGENVTNFYCVQNATFNILENFIFIISFSANSNFLSQSDVTKLPFSVKDISVSGVAELGNNNTTIKFLSSGTCTIYYQIEPFNDVENIFKNPNEPSFYGVKGFSLRINANVSFYFKEKKFRVQRDSMYSRYPDLSYWATDTTKFLTINDPDIIKGKIETGYYPFNYKIENIPGVNPILLMQDYNGFSVYIPQNVPVGCKLTISRIGFENQTTSANFIWI